MNLEKYSNWIFGIFIVILFGISFYFAYIAIFNQFKNPTYNAVYASLLMACISLISFLAPTLSSFSAYFFKGSLGSIPPNVH